MFLLAVMASSGLEEVWYCRTVHEGKAQGGFLGNTFSKEQDWGLQPAGTHIVSCCAPAMGLEDCSTQNPAEPRPGLPTLL